MKSVLKIAIPSVCLSILALGAPDNQSSYANKIPLHQMSVDHEPSTQMMQPNQGQRGYNSQPILKDQDQQSKAKKSNLAKIDQDENPGQVSNSRAGKTQPKKDNREQMSGKASEMKKDGKISAKKAANTKDGQDEKKDQEKGQISTQKVKEDKGADRKDQAAGQTTTGNSNKETTEKMSKGKNVSGMQADEKVDNKKAGNFISAALRSDKTETKKNIDIKTKATKKDEHIATNISVPIVNNPANSSTDTLNSTAPTPGQSNEKPMQQDGNQTNIAPNVSIASINSSDKPDTNKSALNASKVDNSSINSIKPNKSNDVHVSVSTSTNVSTNTKVSASADKARRLSDEKPFQRMKTFRGSVSENNSERQDKKPEADLKQDKKQEMRLRNVQTQNTKKEQTNDAKVNMRGESVGNANSKTNQQEGRKQLRASPRK